MDWLVCIRISYFFCTFVPLTKNKHVYNMLVSETKTKTL